MSTMQSTIQVALPVPDVTLTTVLAADLDSDTVSELISRLLTVHADTIVKAVDIEPGDLRRPELWGLQRVILSQSNRYWSDDELRQLPNDLVLRDASERTESLLQLLQSEVTQRMGVPAIRLVYRPYQLDVTLKAMPDLPQGLVVPWHVGGRMTVTTVIEGIAEEFGIKRIATSGSKSAQIEYAVSLDGSLIHPSSQLVPHLQAVNAAGPPYAIAISVSEKWLTRAAAFAKGLSKSMQRPALPTIASSSSARIKKDSADSASTTRPASIWGSLWYGTGTSTSASTSSMTATPQQMAEVADPAIVNAEWGNTFRASQKSTLRAREQSQSLSDGKTAASRLSTYFWGDGVAQNSDSASASGSLRSRIVSEPIVADDAHQTTSVHTATAWQERAGLGETLDADFEVALDKLGVRGVQRDTMRGFDVAKKQWLIAQQRQTSIDATPTQLQRHHTGALDGHKDDLSVLPSALNTLKRMSFAGAGWMIDSSRAASPDSMASPTPSNEGTMSSQTNGMSPPRPAPLLQTATGWASWFQAGSPAKQLHTGRTQSGSLTKDTPGFYVQTLHNSKPRSPDLLKVLIALRVRLSTAQVSWVQSFLEASGLSSLSTLLAEHDSDSFDDGTSDSIRAECLRCFRVLVSTQSGFSALVEDGSAVAAIVRAFHHGGHRLRAQAAEVLAPLCLLSDDAGHKAVIDGFSAFQAAAKEKHRFLTLVASLNIAEALDGEEEVDITSDAWEFVRASLALVNAIICTPGDLDDRLTLRSEFARRGLNESLAGIRYLDPPDGVRTQFQVYADEKSEDRELAQSRNLLEIVDKRQDADLPATEHIASQQYEDTIVILLKQVLSVRRSAADDVTLRTAVTSLLQSVPRETHHTIIWPDVIDSFLGKVEAELGPIRPRTDASSSLPTTARTGVREPAQSFDHPSPASSTVQPLLTASATFVTPAPAPQCIADDSAARPQVSAGPKSPSAPPSAVSAPPIAPPMAPLPPPLPPISARPVVQPPKPPAAPPLPPPSPPPLLPPSAKPVALQPPWPNASSASDVPLVSPEGIPPAPPMPPPNKLTGPRQGVPAPPNVLLSPPVPPPMIKTTTKQVRTKAFFWTKLAAPKCNGTIWESVDASSVPLAHSELQEAFAVQDSPARQVPSVKTASKVVGLLSTTRAQNVGIMLARIRLSNTALKEAILRLSDRKLSVDKLKLILPLAPTAEEVAIAKAYSGPVESLSPSDQYLVTMSSIPRLPQRLACMLTRRRFEMELEEIRPDIAILRNATDELKASQCFRHTLAAVLAAGNSLNGNTFRGNAAGFQLEALGKLKETRVTSTKAGGKQLTLLHHIASTLVRDEDKPFDFLSECPHLAAGARVSLPALLTAAKALSASIQAIKQEVMIATTHTSEVEATDRFIQVMQVFLSEAEPAMAALTTMANRLEADLVELVGYMGEDPAKMDAETLFQLVVSFGDALHEAVQDIRAIEAKTTSKAPSKTGADLSYRSIGRGGFDAALRDLRAGTGIRRQRQEGSSMRPASRIFLDGSRR